MLGTIEKTPQVTLTRSNLFLWPLALILIAAAGCAHDSSAKPPPTIRERLRGVAVDWDNPQVIQAAAALRELGLPLDALQARARQELARRGVPGMELALAYADDAEALVEQIEMIAPARCADAGPPPALVLCARALVELERAPVALDHPETLTLRGRVLGEALLDEVLLMDPAGHIEVLEPSIQGRAFAAQASSPLKPGRHTVEIMVTTARGLEVAALWHLGVAAPAEPPPFVDRPILSDSTPPGAARRFFELLEIDRAATGLTPVQWSPVLADAAQQRAAHLARDGRLTHAAAIDPTDAVDDSGTPLSWLGENLARTRSVVGARHVIMESPSHRRNHLAPTAEIAGIGAAWRGSGPQRTMFLVELVARRFADADPAELAAQVATWLDAQRAGLDTRLLVRDPDLAERARRIARRLLQEERLPPPESSDRITRALLAERPDLVRAGAALFLIDSTSALSPTTALLDPRHNLVGIGAERRDARSSWYVVVLMAQSSR